MKWDTINSFFDNGLYEQGWLNVRPSWYLMPITTESAGCLGIAHNARSPIKSISINLIVGMRHHLTEQVVAYCDNARCKIETRTFWMNIERLTGELGIKETRFLDGSDPKKILEKVYKKINSYAIPFFYAHSTLELMYKYLNVHRDINYKRDVVIAWLLNSPKDAQEKAISFLNKLEIDNQRTKQPIEEYKRFLERLFDIDKNQLKILEDKAKEPLPFNSIRM